MLNRQEALREVKENILPFWQGITDEKTADFTAKRTFTANRTKPPPLTVQMAGFGSVRIITHGLVWRW